MGLSRGGGGSGGFQEFWGEDVPLEPLAYTRPISFHYLPFIFLLLVYLAFCKLQCLVSIKLFFC